MGVCRPVAVGESAVLAKMKSASPLLTILFFLMTVAVAFGSTLSLLIAAKSPKLDAKNKALCLSPFSANIPGHEGTIVIQL